MPKEKAKKGSSSRDREQKPHWGHGRKGPRAQVWTGSLSFGLVSVPVALVPAARGQDFRFRQLHGTDLAPIEQRRYCSAEEVEVSWDEIGRGYELSADEGGGIVVLTEEELAAAAPERTETIEIEAFIDASQVDPIQFDRPYHLGLTGTSDGDRRAYRLLLEAMTASGRGAIGRMVMRSREYLVLVRPRDGILGLTTLHFHDEVRSYEDIPAAEGAEVSKPALQTAIAVIQELSGEWEPDSYRDHFRERVAALIKERRRQGGRTGADTRKQERSVKEMAAAETESPDLMEALSRALDEAHGRGKKQRPSAASRAGKGKVTSPPGQKQPRRRSLERLSRDELYALAQERRVPGRSKMNKSELLRALADSS